jgi:hypothetical protein
MPRSTWHGMRNFASSTSPVLGELSCLCRKQGTGMADQPEACQVAEAGRGWPRLAAALSLIWRRRGLPEAELAEAPGRLCIDRGSCSSSHCRIATRSYTWPSTVLT